MSNLIRTDYYLGNSKTIVGSPTADLVLETLGKVYIKYGKSTTLLNDLFQLLEGADTSDFSKIQIVNGEKELHKLEFPGEGYFIYDKLGDILYITVGNQYIPLIEAGEFKKDGYVKKSGDTMTGPLEIFTNDSPLIVNSKQLVSNLNVNYLQGHSASAFAKRAVNETINGSWTFIAKCVSRNNWIFEKPVVMQDDLILHKSIGSPKFTSGFAGHGWRMDSNTNTLTVDYLVVRKAMQVYEMVINKISATNGSLWVTNASKCDAAIQPIAIENPSDIKVSSLISNQWYAVYKTENHKKESINAQPTTFKVIYCLIKLTSMVNIPEDKLNQTVSDLIYSGGQEKTQNEDTSYYHLIIVKPGSDTLRPMVNTDSVFSYMDKINDEDTPIIRYSYWYYFAHELSNPLYSNYWLASTDKDEYPVFKPGDIIRCQKVNINTETIKYYDAVVVMQIDSRQFLMQKATSVFDIYSEIKYDEDGNIVTNKATYNDQLYNRGYVDLYTEAGDYDPSTEGKTIQSTRIDTFEEGDNLIQIGNIQDHTRQSAIYITSSDDQSPYMDVISGLNRPDYSVLYRIPVYIKYDALVDGRTHTYYISKTANNNLLGKFSIDKTNNITPDEQGVELYGYDSPTEDCLIQQYVVRKDQEIDSSGNPVFDSQGNPVYKDIYDDYWQYTDTTKVRVGKLDGIYNNTFGSNQPHGYGLYGENVYLTGEFYLNNGKSVISFGDDISILNGNIDNINQLIESGEIVDKLGLAGLFTECIKDENEECTGKYRLNLLGDEIKFSTRPEDLTNGSGTALLKNGMLNVDLINVREMRFDKLIGQGTYNTLYDRKLIFNYKNKKYEVTHSSEPIITTENSGLKVFFQGDKYLLYTHDGFLNIPNGYCKDPDDGQYYKFTNTQQTVNGLSTFVFNLEQTPSDPGGATEIDKSIRINTSRYAICDPLQFGNSQLRPYDYFTLESTYKEQKYTNITVNSLGNGESILYWPSGNVLNAKLIVINANGVAGCVEYFFNDSANVTIEDIALGDVHLRTKDYLKRINYFELVSGIHLVPYIYYSCLLSIQDWQQLITTSPNTWESVWEALLAIKTNGENATNDNSILQYKQLVSDILVRTNVSPKNNYYVNNTVATQDNDLTITIDGEAISIVGYLFNKDYTQEFIDNQNDNYKIAQSDFNNMLFSDGVYITNAIGDVTHTNTVNQEWKVTLIKVSNNKIESSISFAVIDDKIINLEIKPI